MLHTRAKLTNLLHTVLRPLGCPSETQSATTDTAPSYALPSYILLHKIAMLPILG